MTYSQALERRDLEGKDLILYGKKWTNLIAPYSLTDLNKFILQLNLETYTDDDCRAFCTDYKYRAYAVMNDIY